MGYQSVSSNKHPENESTLSVPETKREVKRCNGLDSKESWCIAVASALAFFVCMGFTRADGVMFVALMQEKDTTRELASWPFNLAGAAVVIMAPVTGILSSRFSPLMIGFCGSLLFAAGYSLCYVSTDIYYLSVCLGIIKGSGQAMVITLIPALINNCFERYRATAMGIATTGTPTGGFVLPLLVQYLLEQYGLRGTFLILGGVALHAALGCSIYVFYPRIAAAAESQRTLAAQHTSSNEKTPLVTAAQPKASSKFSLDLIKTVLSTRGFYVVAINQIISLQLVEVFSLVVVDYSVDKGVSYSSAVLLITITSGCEICGRLGFGWITDRGFLSRPVYMLICQSISASTILLFSFNSAYHILAVLAGIMGVVQGSTLSVTHVVFADYLNKKEIALAVAFARSFHGLASLARSPIIGYFRDHLGSYDLLFLTASVVFFAAGLMWLCESLLLRFLKKRNKTRDGYTYV